MPRKPRADSTTSIIKAMSDAAKGALQPPKHVKLPPEAMPYWNGIMNARARDEWSDVDLVVAGQLAKCQADMAAHDDMLMIEGSILTTKFETTVINPRCTLIEQLARKELALMRSLRLGGVPAGETKDAVNRRYIQKQSEKIRSELQGHELLA